MYRTRPPEAFSCSNAGDCAGLQASTDSPCGIGNGVTVDEELLGTPSLEMSKTVLPSEKHFFGDGLFLPLLLWTLYPSTCAVITDDKRLTVC